MSASTAIVAAVLLPLGVAPLIALLGRRPNLSETATLLAALGTFAAVCTLVPKVAAGERPSVHLVEIFPGLPLVFEVEPLGALFALIAAGLWMATSVYSIGYMRGHHEENQTRFFAFFALAIAGALGAAFAGNMLTLFFCYEALTLSTYPLVTHHRSAEAKAGGRVYMGVLLATSIGFLLTGLVATYYIAGTLDFVSGGILAGKAPTWVLGVLLFLYAFGTGKAALMPFHRWLPAAMVAPAPVSALLHAVAVVKAGVFTILKVVVYIFGIDLLADTGLGTYLAYAACATILIGSLVAMTKDNLKARLAYSTVSQLSYIVLGAALANSWGVLGGSLHIAMHAFGKITLFFCAG
ncbi:MAG: proton-conducting transporter membrane subunit, partial [Gemmatimonadota bacterium]|nr:proton-conducting transporter membrane subunit [Gemmatimonadota bacterium]